MEKEKWVKISQINISDRFQIILSVKDNKKRFTLKIGNTFPIFLSAQQFSALLSGFLSLSQKEREILMQILNKLITTNTTTPTSTNSIDDFINNL
ncbi:MAG: hypothetical protein QXS19_06690 [Candidatus Methanomethylicia archaeon]